MSRPRPPAPAAAESSVAVMIATATPMGDGHHIALACLGSGAALEVLEHLREAAHAELPPAPKKGGGK